MLRVWLYGFGLVVLEQASSVLWLRVSRRIEFRFRAQLYRIPNYATTYPPPDGTGTFVCIMLIDFDSHTSTTLGRPVEGGFETRNVSRQRQDLLYTKQRWCDKTAADLGNTV